MSSDFLQVQEEKKNGSSLERVAECLYRMPSSGKYYGQTRVRGKLIRQSLKTTDRKLAERRLDKFLKNAAKLQPGNRKWTFQKAYDEWCKSVLAASDTKESTKVDRQFHFKAICKNWPALKHTLVKEISPTDCELWFAKRKAQISAQRLNNELGTLRMVFQFAIREGCIMDDPNAELKRIKIPRTQSIIPTKNQFSELVNELRRRRNKDATDFVQLLGYSGVRRNEAANLKWEDVDFERGIFVVRGGETGTKNSEQRVVPLFPSLKIFLEGLKSKTLNPTGKIMRIRQCRDAIKIACKEKKLPHFSHHSLRHFFCSNAIEQMVDFKTLSLWLGHKDGGLLVAKTYSHLRDEHSRAMAEKMTFSANNSP